MQRSPDLVSEVDAGPSVCQFRFPDYLQRYFKLAALNRELGRDDAGAAKRHRDTPLLRKRLDDPTSLCRMFLVCPLNAFYERRLPA